MEQELQEYFKKLCVSENNNSYLNCLIVDAITEYYKKENANSGYPLLADGWRDVKDKPGKDEYGKQLLCWDEINGFRLMRYRSEFDKFSSDVTHWKVPEIPTVS